MVLYQGTTLVGPQTIEKTSGFIAPCHGVSRNEMPVLVGTGNKDAPQGLKSLLVLEGHGLSRDVSSLRDCLVAARK